MQQGKFISLEGGEGAGKSTVLQFIRSYLQRAGIRAEFTREPGGTPLAEQIRNVLLHPDTDEIIAPKTELLLMFACREQHIKHRILPWLHAGKWVVSDRYVDASYDIRAAAGELKWRSLKILIVTSSATFTLI